MTSLDLSACKLNTLSSSEMHGLLRQLSYVPLAVTHISFKNNGFQGRNEPTREAYLAFTQALRFIHPSVKTIDIGGNGFERRSHQKFGSLFACFPTTVVSVSLVEGSPAILVARISWPKSYYDMTTRALAEQNILEVARILLDDYTKGGSTLLRFFTLHWDRHYVDEVEKIVVRIKDGGYVAKKLIADLRAIKIENNCGSFARRVSFIEHLYAKHPALVATMQRPSGTGEGLEMAAVTSRP